MKKQLIDLDNSRVPTQLEQYTNSSVTDFCITVALHVTDYCVIHADFHYRHSVQRVCCLLSCVSLSYVAVYKHARNN